MKNIPKRAAFAAVVVGCALTVAAGNAADRFTVEKKDGGVEIKIDGKVFTKYQEKFQNKPILHPIIGPTGKEMTRPLKGKGDHPHHSSLWFTHGNVNGIDYWHKGGLIEHQEYATVEGGKQAVLKTKSAWKDKAGKQLATEVRSMVFDANDDARWIDIDIVFTATAAVTFGKTKEGSFGVRVWPTTTVKTGGTILNSEGHKNADAWSKPAAWVDYHGQIDGETLGIAIMTHPSSFRYPTPWHVRTYGLFTSNPFMKKELKLAAGEKFVLHYRFVFHKGTTADADIAGIYKDYAAKKF